MGDMKAYATAVEARVEFRAVDGRKGPDGTNLLGWYKSLPEAFAAAKQACGDLEAQGESVPGPGKGMSFCGPRGTAYVGW